ncbi:MAG: peptide-methionine (S)-S-oxide reductase [Verrucomicrobiota bacterium]
MITSALEEIYLAGGCLWGVQEFVRHLPGVVHTEAGRANGDPGREKGGYNGYAECVKVGFDPRVVSVRQLVGFLFEIIDPESLDSQGPDTGRKYRTGVYSEDDFHLEEARAIIADQAKSRSIVVEVVALSSYEKSAPEHQDRLARYPEEKCHIPRQVLHRYKEL